MNPDNILFNASIVGPKKFRKDKILGQSLEHHLPRKVKLHRSPLSNVHPQQTRRTYLSYVYRGPGTLIILDDCAASRDVKQGRNGPVNVAFSARHRETAFESSYKR